MIEQGLIGLLLLLGWMLPTIRAGMRERSTPGLTAAVAAFTAAGVFHDLTHGLLVLLVGCLLAGLQASAVEDFAHGLVRADPHLGRDVADGKLRVVVVRPSSAV